jgi:hypothetical protein
VKDLNKHWRPKWLLKAGEKDEVFSTIERRRVAIEQGLADGFSGKTA